MVEKDISLFLEEFRKTEQTLSDFNYLWKKKNMSCIIYCSPNPKVWNAAVSIGNVLLSIGKSFS